MYQNKRDEIAARRLACRQQEERAIKNLMADIDAWDADALGRLLRSGFSYTESLELLRCCRSEKGGSNG